MEIKKSDIYELWSNKIERSKHVMNEKYWADPAVFRFGGRYMDSHYFLGQDTALDHYNPFYILSSL